MYFKGDFHIHSSASDGLLSPDKLVKRAYDNGIDIISLTDHDTVSGVKIAIESGKLLGITVIPGIELTTIHNGEPIHILGYFKDNSFHSIILHNFLNSIKESRVLRAQKIVDNLNYYFNIKVDFDLVLTYSKNIIARPHIARAIINSGYNFSWEYIFNNLIGKESPAYVPNEELSLSTGIKLLKSYNACVVLAHPVLIKKTPIEELLTYDFDGIEAIYYMNSQNQTIELINLANKYNKFITAGSDYHGLLHDNNHGDIGSVFLQGAELSKFLSELNI